MEQLNQDIKSGNYKQLYLLYGNETYLLHYFKKSLIKGMIPKDDTMNISFFSGKAIDVGGVIDFAETLPFFAERRLLVIEDSGFFKSGQNALADYIEHIPETTSFVFVEKEVDKRNKLYKTASKVGLVAELNQQDIKKLIIWIKGKAKEESFSIDDSTIEYMLNRIGADVENILSELHKLFAYAQGREVIDRADIDEICCNQVSNQIFEMINAVAEYKQQKALDLYYELLTLKEPALGILSMMTRQYRLMYYAKDFSNRRVDSKEMASAFGLHPFAAKKHMERASRYKLAQLRSIYEECVVLDREVKSGKLQDRLAVELFIIKHSTKAKQS